MEYILIVSQILITLGIIVCGLLINHYFPNYLAEKGKNLATKEDVQELTRLAKEGENLATKKDIQEITRLAKEGENLATKKDIQDITHLVESVKTEYSHQLEKLKDDYSKERERLKVALSFQSETYKRAANVRFETILTLWASTEALLPPNTNFADKESIRASIKRIDESVAHLNNYSILFSSDLFAALDSYLKKMSIVLSNSEKKFEKGEVNTENSAKIAGVLTSVAGMYSPSAGMVASLLSSLGMCQ